MTQSYRDLLYNLEENDLAYQTLTLQYSFILYLVLGQFALLLLWRLLARLKPGEATRLRNFAFGLYLLLGQAALLFAWPPLMNAWLSADRFLLADIVVTFHLGLVVTVLGALVLILAGWPFGWRWTRNFWFRMAQLLVIEVVAGQAIVGLECPLTTAEKELRGGAGNLRNVANSSAVGQWANGKLYFSDPIYVRQGTILAGNTVGAGSGPFLPAVVVACCATEPAVVESNFFPYLYGGVGAFALLTWILVPPGLPWSSSEKRDSKS